MSMKHVLLYACGRAIPITVHRCDNEVVIVNSHGLGDSKEGYKNRYVKIAQLLQSLKVGAVVRYQYSVAPEQSFVKPIILVEFLKSVLNYILGNTRSICGSDNPEIYLAGYSAGAAVSAAVAYEFPQVTKMLLIAPSADVGIDNLKRGLSMFKGELYITLGDNDHVASPENAMALSQWAIKARFKKVVIVPNCDHHFTGETNRRILTKAYLWAFKGDETYPSPEV